MIEEAASLWSSIKKYEEILARDPQALSFAPLAELYRKAGLFEDALVVAKRGAALYPDFASGQMVLARIFRDKAMKKECTAALESVVRITPENIEAQRLLSTIYRDAGNIAAADQCYAVIQSLEPDSADNLLAPEGLVQQQYQGRASAESTSDMPMQDFAPSQSREEFDEEQILDADVLELTDELEEEESSDDISYSAFAAAPERPSLQAAAIAVQPPVIPQEESPEESTASSPVASATIAELYISQGFKDKGADIYKELLLADPENAVYRNRLNALTSAVDSPALTSADAATVSPEFIAADPGRVPPSQEVVETLDGWLSNIRRVKECR